MSQNEPTALTSDMMKFIEPTAKSLGLDTDFAVGLLGAENNGFDDLRTDKVSPKGARGLYQLMPSAVKDAGYDPKTFNYDDPVLSTQAGLKYAKILLDKYKDPVLAVASYNYGQGNMDDLLRRGGGLEDLPGETQNYLPKFDNFSNGYLRKSQRPPNAKTEVAPADPSANTATNLRAAPQVPSPPDPQAPEQAAAIPPDVARKYGDTGSGLRTLYDTFVEPVTRFPNEVAQQVGGAVGLVDHPKSIDPVDALTFGMSMFPLTKTGQLASRGVNAALGGVMAAAEIAHGQAKRQATEYGVDYDSLGTGAKTSLLLDNIKTDTLTYHMPAIIAGMGLGWIFGKPRKEFVTVGKDPITLTEMLQAAPPAMRAHDTAVLFNKDQATQEVIDAVAQRTAARRAAEIGAENTATAISGIGRNAETNALARQEAAGVQAGNVAAGISDVGQFAPVNAAISGAEARTGIERLRPKATKAERQWKNTEIRDRLLEEFHLPTTNPGPEIYQGELLGPYGARSLNPEGVDALNKELQILGNKATETDTLRGRLKFMTRPLNDPLDVTPRINALRRKASTVSDPVRRSQLLADAATEEQKLVTPTVETLINRTNTFAALQRELAQRKDVPDATKQLVNDFTNRLRNEDGYAENLLGPEEAAAWAKGREASRIYHEQDNAINMVTNIFGDTKPGAGAFRNKLEANKDQLVAQFGKEIYSNMQYLSRDLDLLTSMTPGRVKTAKVPGIPEPAAIELQSIPDMPTPKAKPLMPVSSLAAMEAAKARSEQEQAPRTKLTVLMNTTYSLARRLQAAAGTGAVGMIGSGLGGKNLQEASIVALTGGVTAFLATSPTARKAFSKMVRFADNMESNEFAKAYMRFWAANQIDAAQQSKAMIQEPNAGPPNPAAIGPPTPARFQVREQPSSLAQPKLASRRTGMVPAPQPPTRSGGAHL